MQLLAGLGWDESLRREIKEKDINSIIQKDMLDPNLLRFEDKFWR